jgi:hypothetical protein
MGTGQLQGKAIGGRTFITTKEMQRFVNDLPKAPIAGNR